MFHPDGRVILETSPANPIGDLGLGAVFFETVAGESVDITGYEVIATKVDHEDENGFSRPMFDIHLPASTTGITIPEGFFEPGTIYELEVLVLEESGNQTISVGFFSTL